SRTALIIGRTVLRKALGQVPTVTVQPELLDPKLGNPLYVVAGRLGTVIEVIEHTVGMGGLHIEKGIVRCGLAPITAAFGVPEPEIGVLATGMVEYHVQDHRHAPTVAFVHQ